MSSPAGALALPFQRDPLKGLRRYDIPLSSMPRRDDVVLRKRTDLPPAEIDDETTRLSVATEWIGRVAAVVALVLFVLVMMAINKGMDVQNSARDVVDNFHTANDYFDDRTDLDAPATARKQLEALQKVLADLNKTTTADVTTLNALLPDMKTLLVAGQGDSRIAVELQGVARTLRDSAGALHQISSSADSTVTDVDAQLDLALDLVNKLNNELARATRKLAPIPAQDGLIPPPGGHK